jgi:hypothetical protein
MRLLLERGADPNALSTSDIAKVPPLGTAAFVRSAPLARVLLDSGANPNGRGEASGLHSAAQNEDGRWRSCSSSAAPTRPRRRRRAPAGRLRLADLLSQRQHG